MQSTANKKSRIYGTSDRFDLSIYLSALLKLEIRSRENPLPRESAPEFTPKSAPKSAPERICSLLSLAVTDLPIHHMIDR